MEAAYLFILFNKKQFEMAFIGSFGMHGIEDLFSRAIKMRMRMIHLVVYGTCFESLQNKPFPFTNIKQCNVKKR